ncbi:MAG: hypothetical protein NVS3B23_01370 [Candidatus Saccharimonadales bacterium]
MKISNQTLFGSDHVIDNFHSSGLDTSRLNFDTNCVQGSDYQLKGFPFRAQAVADPCSEGSEKSDYSVAKELNVIFIIIVTIVANMLMILFLIKDRIINFHQDSIL